MPSARHRPRSRSRLFPAALLICAAGLAFAGCFGDGDARRQARRELSRWEDRRLAPQDSLAAMLRHEDAHVRLAAVRTAGLIGRDDALPGLVERLSDRSRTVQHAAAWALGLLADPEAVPALERAASASDGALREAALAALAHVPNDGAALLAATAAERTPEAALAWNGLRNHAASVDSTGLAEAIVRGLGHPAADVRWRVLRCAERHAAEGLTPALRPFVRSDIAQERVHAYRALAACGGGEALAAVAEGFEHHESLHGRERSRVLIAAYRALGALAPQLVGEDDGGRDLERLGALLAEGAGDEDPHVAETALAAMQRLVVEAPLPPEAAVQESLLPVWRIRLARVAARHLDHAEPGVRAAAAGARAALRGAGALPDLRARFAAESTPFAAAALIAAVGSVQPAPWAEPPFPDLPACPPSGLLPAAVVEAVADRADDLAPGYVLNSLARAARRDAGPVARATALARCGEFPGATTAAAVLAAAREPAGPWRSDIVLASMGSLAAIFADTTWTPADGMAEAAAAFLTTAFDDGDIRIRLAAREAAIATSLLPAHLIPGEASLRATLPAHERSAQQPPLALPHEAPEVIVTTRHGEFTIALDGENAPNTCAMFAALVTGGFYDGLVFHRVVPDFVAQGGDPTGTGWGGPGYTIRSEWSRLPYERGAVGIAHSGKDTGGCQFFVTLSPQPHLEGRYTVFGKVTDGMDVVDRICVTDTMSLVLRRP